MQSPLGTARAGERGNVGASEGKFHEEDQTCVSEVVVAAGSKFLQPGGRE